MYNSQLHTDGEFFSRYLRLESLCSLCVCLRLSLVGISESVHQSPVFPRVDAEPWGVQMGIFFLSVVPHVCFENQNLYAPVLVSPSDTEMYRSYEGTTAPTVEGSVCLFAREPVRPYTKHEPFEKVCTLKCSHRNVCMRAASKNNMTDEKYVETEIGWDFL